MSAEIVAEASEMIRNRIATISAESIAMLQLCESPVEQIFLAAAIEKADLNYCESLHRAQALFLSDSPLAQGIFTLLVEPQAEIDCFDSKYRADFLFSLWRHSPGGRPNLWGKTVVEIDGHAFHEKTKAQVSRDKKRDRTLLREGYFSLRFSGSDVFNNPHGTVEEVLLHMSNCAHDAVMSCDRQGRLSELLWEGR